MLLIGALPFAAVSICLLVLLLADRASRLRQERHAASSLPRWLRRGRPLIAVLVFYLKPWVTRAARLRLQKRLRQAGLQAVTVDDLIGCQGLCALLGLALALGGWGMALDGRAPLLGVSGVCAAAVLGWMWPAYYLLGKARQRARAAVRDLPFMLDLLCLTMEAGLNLLSGLQHYGKQGPSGVLKEEVLRVLADVRTGLPRTEALQAWAGRLRTPAMEVLLAQLVQAEQQGLSLLTILRTQADQQRQQRMLDLEKQALEAPVKLLLPLIVFIFPCTFLILGFPLVMQGLEALP
ncbi:MAG: type II secretion system F family protein [Pigmentiphaga sp.]|nr:type II secretion system F family protein [Pigmentiphaga sp.]